MVEYYQVLEGCTLYDSDDKPIGTGGDVVALATDSKDSTERKCAQGILMGQWSKVAKLSGKPAKKKATKKDASYKTTEATPEG